MEAFIFWALVPAVTVSTVIVAAISVGNIFANGRHADAGLGALATLAGGGAALVAAFIALGPVKDQLTELRQQNAEILRQSAENALSSVSSELTDLKNEFQYSRQVAYRLSALSRTPTKSREERKALYETTLSYVRQVTAKVDDAAIEKEVGGFLFDALEEMERVSALTDAALRVAIEFEARKPDQTQDPKQVEYFTSQVFASLQYLLIRTVIWTNECARLMRDLQSRRDHLRHVVRGEPVKQILN
ncbi:hypothetical protein [Methylopila sp. Yamaguchi]|uniref:hypothetical protein n=1 Tax=Methylopila sp. Yamaguchi TaxID=1437817 RepID=UPI000CAD04AA|nr:hypothetical protein [Methylopila sp. Yamaguchi]GBD48079.1 hypothetical protein METY_1292 [Methylopila sp. Yamaguchi]